MNDIKDTLKERGTSYGDFKTQAALSQKLVITCEQARAISVGFPFARTDLQLDPVMNEAMKMILHKIARIYNGDPEHVDSWRDIAGYAQLSVNYLENGKTTCFSLED